MGSYVILERRGALALAQYLADTPVLLAFGEQSLLEAEARALDLLKGTEADLLDIAEVHELGEDEEHGCFLALRSTPASELPPFIAPEQLLAGLRALIVLLRKLDAVGLQWVPRSEDAELRVLPQGGVRIRISRVRVVPSTPDVSALRIVRTLGAEMLRHAQMTVPTRLLHLLFESPGVPAPEPDPDSVDEELVRCQAEHEASRHDVDPMGAVGADIGFLRERNEDAVAFSAGSAGDWAVAVVCDGISSSVGADRAARIAADTTLAQMVARIEEDPAQALEHAIEAAHLAICVEESNGRTRPDSSVAEATLGTTVVAACLQGRRVTVGWVGDSRAYLIGQATAVQLTRDHSWINEIVESGTVSYEEACKSPYAHALTRCLGPLEGTASSSHARPEVIDLVAKEPGWLILCTDGLWNHYAEADWIAMLVRQAGDDATPAIIVRLLINAALMRGGHDNVSVAAVPVH